MRGTLEPEADHAAQSSREIEALVVESRFGRGDVALRQVESMLPAFEQRDDATMLLHALYARALIVRRLGAPAEDALDACDTLEDAARTRGQTLWAAVACALRAQTRVDEGDVVAATADLARADIDLSPVDLASPVAFRLLDALAVVYARLRVHDRLDDVRERLESTIEARTPLERAIHWAGWCSELAVRAMEPVAMGEGAPATQSLQQAVEIGTRIDALPPAAVPPPLRRGVSAVRALAAAYRGRPSEALRVLGQDAFGEARQLPPVERQIATLAAMRAHAHVGSIASARSLDDAAGQTRSTLVHLVLSVCRARERLWLETHAGGQVVPVLNRLVDLLVRLGWHGMDLVAEITRQSMEHHALREESRTDALTGVGNRRALDEELRQLVRFSQLPLSLVLVDVDDFKNVNDRFTHVVGDEVLRQVAAGLSGQLRAGDRLLRFGGDEFVALLPATGDQEAHRVAARMSRAVEALDWNELASGLRVTVTTGSAALWSLTERRPDADAERLFQRADEALLSAKRRRSTSGGAQPAAAAAAPAPAPAPARGAAASAPPARRNRPPVEQPPTRPVTRAELRAANRAETELPDPMPVPAPAPGPASGPIPTPVASLFNEPTSFVQPAPVPQPVSGRPFGPGYDHYAALGPGVPAGPAGAPPALPPAAQAAATPPSAMQPPAAPAPMPTRPLQQPEPAPEQFRTAPDQFRTAPDQFRPAPDQFRTAPDQFRTAPADPPKAWEPGWRPEWATSDPAPYPLPDPLTDPLTGPLSGPLLDPLLDPRLDPSLDPPLGPSGTAAPSGHTPSGHTPSGHTPSGHTPSGHTPSGHTSSGYARPGRELALPDDELVHPETEALEVIDLTSGLTRRRRAIASEPDGPPPSDPAWNVHSTNGYAPNGYAANAYPADSHGPSGYRPDGYGSNGHGSDRYGSNGHGSNGHGSNGHGSNGYDPNARGSNGYDPNAYSSNGYNTSGSDPNGYGSNSYDPTARGSNGYSSNGHHPSPDSTNGYHTSGSDPNGYGSNGYGSNGYGSNGYGSNGYNPTGYGYGYGPGDNGSAAVPGRRPEGYPDDPDATPPRGTGRPDYRSGPPAVIDLTGRGRRRDRERLRAEPDERA